MIKVVLFFSTILFTVFCLSGCLSNRSLVSSAEATHIQQSAIAEALLAPIPEPGKFEMDIYEVTNAQFAQFLNAQGNQVENHTTWLESDNVDVRIHKVNELWQADAGYANHPVTLVSWYGAKSYCEWRNARLPTDGEWEQAARGGLAGKRYPWGDEEPVCTPGSMNGANFNMNGCQNDTLPVGSHASNGYGLYDMAGNVLEWTASEVMQGDAPIIMSYVRGGSWKESADYLRMDWKGGLEFNNKFNDLGFRCAR